MFLSEDVYFITFVKCRYCLKLLKETLLFTEILKLFSAWWMVASLFWSSTQEQSWTVSWLHTGPKRLFLIYKLVTKQTAVRQWIKLSECHKDCDMAPCNIRIWSIKSNKNWDTFFFLPFVRARSQQEVTWHNHRRTLMTQNMDVWGTQKSFFSVYELRKQLSLKWKLVHDIHSLFLETALFVLQLGSLLIN